MVLTIEQLGPLLLGRKVSFRIYGKGMVLTIEQFGSLAVSNNFPQPENIACLF